MVKNQNIKNLILFLDLKIEGDKLAFSSDLYKYTMTYISTPCHMNNK